MYTPSITDTQNLLQWFSLLELVTRLNTTALNHILKITYLNTITINQLLERLLLYTIIVNQIL